VPCPLFTTNVIAGPERKQRRRTAVMERVLQTFRCNGIAVTAVGK